MMNATSRAKARSPRFLCKLSDLGRPGVPEHYITFHSILRHLLPVLMDLEHTGRDIKWQYLVLFFYRVSELDIRQSQQPLAWGVAMAATLLFSFPIYVLCLPVNICLLAV